MSTSPYRQSLQFSREGVLTICFFQRGGVDFKGNKTVFRGSMDINFPGTKGGKMIFCFFSKVYDGKFQKNLTELISCFTIQ